MFGRKSFSKIASVTAIALGAFVPLHAAKAQAFADQWWDYGIAGNQGDFNLGSMVQFSCQAGQGPLTVTVNAGGSPRQTVIEFRHGGNFYRSTAQTANNGNAYTFTVPRNRFNGFFRILTRFDDVNIDVQAAGPIFMETGSRSGSTVAETMADYCTNGGFGQPNNGNNGGGGFGIGAIPLPCQMEFVSRSGNGASVNLTIRNNSGNNRTIYWLDGQGDRQYYNDLAPGASYVQQTSVGHPWVATDSNGRCRALGIAQGNGAFNIND